ncbi:hypothetical protein RBSWK_01404 [Rhodopirellula baltica SWK14]|uniref:Uncharacterized protein n=1 Tax=Rhodopirellula baltica SWK14 TaxID=993516 RepID=L7CL28_RHOBT|nr:hypothetical protein RBSWK_01404 [Rhodopirellula baltica SWK14]
MSLRFVTTDAASQFNCSDWSGCDEVTGCAEELSAPVSEKTRSPIHSNTRWQRDRQAHSIQSTEAFGKVGDRKTSRSSFGDRDVDGHGRLCSTSQ